jgi:hypothetical protein
MSMFEDQHYRWRETYFVLFASARRPTLSAMKKALSALDDRYVLVHAHGDPKGRFESIGLLSPDDFAAIDISYMSGDEVIEQGAELFEEIQRGLAPSERKKLKQICKYDARFDVLHFERVPDPDEGDGDDDLLDPGAVLIVLEALARLTEGVAVDPQSGTVV